MDLKTRVRPNTLADVWANKEVKAILQGFVDNPNRPSTYLFVGNSGCGKTTCARAFAKDLGAEDVDIEIINMSQHTGVDDIRNLIQESQYKFMSSKKIYILEEVHRLSAQGQSAALLLLEQPPKDVYYFLCTTDPQMLSTALKSRCTTLTLKPIDTDEMPKYLRKVCRLEKLNVEPDLLEAIAEKTEGVPREALGLLDMVVGKTEEEAQDIIRMYNGCAGETDPDIKALCQLFLKGGDWKAYAEILKKIKGSDAESVRRSVLGYMSAVLLNSGNRKAATVLQDFSEPLFNTGFSGLVLQCFTAFCELK